MLLLIKNLHSSDSPVYCLRCCWSEASVVAKLVAELEANGAMEYTTVVVANASDPAPLQYIALIQVVLWGNTIEITACMV